MDPINWTDSQVKFSGCNMTLQEDKDTRSVFGEYVSIYDIQDAVEDGAIVPIYYDGEEASGRRERI